MNSGGFSHETSILLKPTVTPIDSYISLFWSKWNKAPMYQYINQTPKFHTKIYSLLSQSGIILWLPVSSFYIRTIDPLPTLQAIDVI